jgi:hypothetical protein
MIEVPSIGRFVRYYPASYDSRAFANNPNGDPLPALVMQVGDGLVLWLNVFTMSDSTPILLRYNICHINQRIDSDLPAWDWPEIK